MASVKMHLDKSQCNSICRKNWQYIYLYTFINAKNLYKMPNMHFNLNFPTLQQFRLPAGLSVVRPGSTMARASIFSHNKGNHVGFMKLLFRRKFIHCTMMLPFILY